jgi:hypothetical protein
MGGLEFLFGKMALCAEISIGCLGAETIGRMPRNPGQMAARVHRWLVQDFVMAEFRAAGSPAESRRTGGKLPAEDGIRSRSDAVSSDSHRFVHETGLSERARAVHGLLHSRAAFGIALPLSASDRRHLGCGCSSVVEHDLAKVGVEGSSPFARSRFLSRKLKFDEGPLHWRAFRFAGTKAVARVAGQREEYLLKALHDDKSGVRSGGDRRCRPSLEQRRDRSARAIIWRMCSRRTQPSPGGGGSARMERSEMRDGVG